MALCAKGGAQNEGHWPCAYSPDVNHVAIMPATAMSPIHGCTAHALGVVSAKVRYHVYPQVLLPCIAELSRLPLRELLLGIYTYPGSAAVVTPFQQLPPTLRQLELLLSCKEDETWHSEAEVLSLASPQARLQTTALRQVIAKHTDRCSIQSSTTSVAAYS